MVSTKLLTEDLLIARLHEPGFVAALEASVGRFTTDILEGRGERGPAGGEPEALAIRESVVEAAESLVSSFFHSDAFAEIVHRVTGSVAEGALRMETGRVLPEPERLAELVDAGVGTLSSGPTAPAAEAAVHRWVASHLDADTPLVDIVGSGSIERLQGTIPGLYEPALDALLRFLRDPGTRGELAVRGRELLSRVLKRLNLFQRFLVSATQYDRTLRENMPAVIDDLIESVERAGRTGTNRERLIASVQEEIRVLGDTGIGTLLERFDLHAERLVGRLFELAVELLSREDVRRRISDGVVGFVDAHRDRTLGEVIGSIFGLEADDLRSRLVLIADNWIARSGNVDRLAERVVEFALRHIGRAEQVPLGRLLPLTDEQKQRIDRFLADRLRALVERRVPEIIEKLDVYTMVVDKINGLDIESVEQLLLMVIARHLKWINLFGALLGSIIGGTQVIIGLLT